MSPRRNVQVEHRRRLLTPSHAVLVEALSSGMSFLRFLVTRCGEVSLCVFQMRGLDQAPCPWFAHCGPAPSSATWEMVRNSDS